jgi:hypothetical protein
MERNRANTDPKIKSHTQINQDFCTNIKGKISYNIIKYIITKCPKSINTNSMKIDKKNKSRMQSSCIEHIQNLKKRGTAIWHYECNKILF